MKKRIPRRHASGVKSFITFAKTGEHCPLNGWWASEWLEGSHYVSEGSIMPAVKGESVIWTLVAEPASRKPKYDLPTQEPSREAIRA